MTLQHANLGNLTGGAFGDDDGWKRRVDLGHRRTGLTIAASLPDDLNAALKTLEYARQAVIQMLGEEVSPPASIPDEHCDGSPDVHLA